MAAANSRGDELTRIEQRMRELVQADAPITKTKVTREEASAISSAR